METKPPNLDDNSPSIREAPPRFSLKESASGWDMSTQIIVGVVAVIIVIAGLIFAVIYRAEFVRGFITVVIVLFSSAIIGIVGMGIRRGRNSLRASRIMTAEAQSQEQRQLQNERESRLDDIAQGRIKPILSSQGLLLRNSETLWFQTAASQSKGAGTFYVTSLRIVFDGLEQPSDVPIEYVNSVKHQPGELQIVGKTANATRVFGMADPELAAAHIVRAVRAFNRQVDVGFERGNSRQIPQDVKVVVWQRDGGKCVQCGAADYLEYDHIIAHAKGGANTVNNIQLLCRRCNLKKSDAI